MSTFNLKKDGKFMKHTITDTQASLLDRMMSTRQPIEASLFGVMLITSGGNARTKRRLLDDGLITFYPYGAKGAGSYRVTLAGEAALSDWMHK